MCLSQFVLSHLYEQHPMQIIFLSKCGLSFSTGIDLNLPLDEFGAVDFDYVQNLTGTVLSLCFFVLLVMPCLIWSCFFTSHAVPNLQSSHLYEQHPMQMIVFFPIITSCRH